MNTALVIPVRWFGRWEGFLHSWGCFRFFLPALLLCAPLVVRAQWEPDRRLTFCDSTSSTTYNNAWFVAVSGDTIHIVWYDYRWHSPEIYYKRSIDGGITWGPDIRLTFDLAHSEGPSVAVTNSLVHVVWLDTRDGNLEIYYKRSQDAGMNWEPDFRLTYNNAYSEYPSIAVSDSNVHVVWLDTRVGNYVIYYKRSTDGGFTWEQDTRLSDSLQVSWGPSIAVSGSSVHVVWYTSEIYYKRSTDNGYTWGPDIRLTYAPLNSVCPSIAVSGLNVHLVWLDDRTGVRQIFYKYSSDGGTFWGPDSQITNVNGYKRDPSVAVSGSNVHVTWEDERVGEEIYYMKSTNSGVSWEPETRLTNDPGRSWLPSIAVSGSKAHVVWCDNRSGDWEIYYKRNPTGNSGVEVSSGSFQPPTSNLSFSVVPNPFTSFAILPGHEAERFALYDISGRRVGVYRGDRVGWDVSPGVYFLMAEGKKGRPVRVVKVR